MKHLFIPYELALIAKEKGFDEPCFAYWSLSHITEEYNFHFIGEYTHYRDHYLNFVGLGLRNSDLKTFPTGRMSNSMVAPLYQQIVDWFREKYKIDINWDIEVGAKLIANPVINHNYVFGINKFEEVDDIIYVEDKDFYTAYNKAIEEAFKLI